MEIPESAWQITAGGGVIAVLGLIARFFLRMFSKDQTASAAERSEITQISRLEGEIGRLNLRIAEERARADQAFKERNEAIERGAQAVGEVHALRIQVISLEGRIKALEELLKSFYDPRLR